MIPVANRQDSGMTLTDFPATDEDGNNAANRLKPRDENIFTLQSLDKPGQDQTVSIAAPAHIKVDAQTVFRVAATHSNYKKIYSGCIVILIATITVAVPVLYFLYKTSLPENVVLPAVALQLASIGITGINSYVSGNRGAESAISSSGGENYAITSAQTENTTDVTEAFNTTMPTITGDDDRSEEKPEIIEQENTLQALQAETEFLVEPQASGTIISIASDGSAVRFAGQGTQPDTNEIHIIRDDSADRMGELINAAYTAYLSGRYTDALQGYRDVLMEMPDNRDALLGMAAIAQRMGDPGKALQTYLKIYEIYPDDPVAAAGLMNLMEGQSYQGSVQTIGKILHDHPQAAYLYFMLGTLHAAANHWPEARKSFSEALRLEDDNPDYAYNLAVSLDHLGDVPGARENYSTALELAHDQAVSFDTSVVMVRISSLSASASGQ